MSGKFVRGSGRACDGRGRPSHLIGKAFDENRRRPLERDGALDRVLQLADVARPAVRLQARQGASRDPGNRLPHLAGKPTTK